MQFGAFFVGQRPLLHGQYADESKINPNPVSSILSPQSLTLLG